MSAGPSNPNTKKMRAIATVAIFVGALFISACNSTKDLGLDAESLADAASTQATPIAEKIGSGGVVVGLIIADEPDNLSDGLPNSAYLSAKLAAQSLKGAKVTLIVRRYDHTQTTLQSAVSAFVEGQAGIIIGPDDDEGAAVIAKLLQGKNIPVISLGRGVNSKFRIYGSGLSVAQEIAVVVAEMKKRKYRSILIAGTKSSASKAYSAAFLKAIKGTRIKAVEVDIGDMAQGVVAAGNLIETGKNIPQAVLFATGPKAASAFILALSDNTKFAKLDIVGNNGWSTAPNDIPKTRQIWFATLASNHLKDFSRKFAATSKRSPTLRGAIVYDLVVMAGVLPKVVPEDPYGEDVLSNSQGFTGQSGKFRFGKDGAIQRSYVITTLN
ncbi:MAG: hypothetical protein COB78_13435 [Hyphomicrobiales bacterium]|nr:MAG: hypothetical protein COB78_13435 [Hyphomicrobiales bacterium]